MTDWGQDDYDADGFPDIYVANDSAPATLYHNNRDATFTDVSLESGCAFSIDGKEEYRVTRAMVERHGRWVFDTPKFLVINLAVGGAYPLAVNHATEPYVGMPQTTVDVVKRGDAVMIVDWVRVTRDKS